MGAGVRYMKNLWEILSVSIRISKYLPGQPPPVYRLILPVMSISCCLLYYRNTYLLFNMSEAHGIKSGHRIVLSRIRKDDTSIYDTEMHSRPSTRHKIDLQIAC